MAKVEYTGPDEIMDSLGKLGRDYIRKVVMAGADACVEETKNQIVRYKHVVTNSMKDNVKPGKYYEDFNSGYVYVYPQDVDSRGVSNTVKAFVINYGLGRKPNTVRSRGKKLKNKTGDHFITGKNDTMDKIVSDAMQAESDRLLSEIMGD